MMMMMIVVITTIAATTAAVKYRTKSASHHRTRRGRIQGGVGGSLWIKSWLGDNLTFGSLGL